MIEEFDGSFLIRAFLIERECVYEGVRYITEQRYLIPSMSFDDLTSRSNAKFFGARFPLHIS